MLSSQIEDKCLLKSDKEASKNDGSLTWANSIVGAMCWEEIQEEKQD